MMQVMYMWLGPLSQNACCEYLGTRQSQPVQCRQEGNYDSSEREYLLLKFMFILSFRLYCEAGTSTKALQGSVNAAAGPITSDFNTFFTGLYSNINMRLSSCSCSLSLIYFYDKFITFLFQGTVLEKNILESYHCGFVQLRINTAFGIELNTTI